MLLATSALASAALPTTMVHADNATWLGTPADGNFNNAANWDVGVPDGTATFNASNTKDIQFTLPTTLGGITVMTPATSGAGDYAFTTTNVGLTFTGAGLSVGSGASLTLNVNGGIVVEFQGSSTAGQAQININAISAMVLFAGDSTAGSSTLNVGNVANPGVLALLQFSETSKAGQAQITIASGADLSFVDGSTANHATIINNAGGTVSFDNTAFAGSAQIRGAGTVSFQGSSRAGSASIDSDGKIFFVDQASGETANIKLNDNAALDISGLQTAGTTLGSLAGSGNVFLGGNSLAVGGNDAFTVFSGVIQDGGESGGKRGRLIKDGVGALTLSGINTYTGATVVNNGALVVDGSIASSSGVTVLHDGTLAGIGTVSSTIVDGGTLAPGHSFGRLTVQGDLLFTTKSGGCRPISCWFCPQPRPAPPSRDRRRSAAPPWRPTSRPAPM